MHQQDDQKYNCISCMTSFCSWSNFKRHNREKHGEDGIFSCTYCAFKTNRGETLNRHILNRHSTIKMVSGILRELFEDAVSKKVSEATQSEDTVRDVSCSTASVGAASSTEVISEYERIRMRNIAERDALFRQMYPDFENEVRALKLKGQREKSKKKITYIGSPRKSSRLRVRSELLEEDSQVNGLNEEMVNLNDVSGAGDLAMDGDDSSSQHFSGVQGENIEEQVSYDDDDPTDVIGLGNYACVPCKMGFR